MLTEQGVERGGGIGVSVPVGVTATRVLSKNSARRAFLLVNVSDTDIYLAFDAAPVLLSGIPLLANGGHFGQDGEQGYLWQGDIFGVSSLAAKTVAGMEFL